MPGVIPTHHLQAAVQVTGQGQLLRRPAPGQLLGGGRPAGLLQPGQQPKPLGLLHRGLRIVHLASLASKLRGIGQGARRGRVVGSAAGFRSAFLTAGRCERMPDSPGRWGGGAGAIGDTHLSTHTDSCLPTTPGPVTSGIAAQASHGRDLKAFFGTGWPGPPIGACSVAVPTRQSLHGPLGWAPPAAIQRAAPAASLPSTWAGSSVSAAAVASARAWQRRPRALCTLA